MSATLRDVEETFRALVLSREPRTFADVDEARQKVYRELVQNNLRGTIRRATPHALRLAGPEAYDALVGRFLDEVPIATRFTREIPGAFTAWLMSLPADELPHPAFGELCHFEAIEVEVILALTTPRRPSEPVDDATIVTDSSARLCVYRHPVHKVGKTTSSWPQPLAAPTVLLVFQEAERFVVEPLSLVLGKVLLHAANGASIGAAIDAVVAEATAAGTIVLPARLKSELIGLHHRGAIAAFPYPSAP